MIDDVELLCSEDYSLENDKVSEQQALQNGMEIVIGDETHLTFDLDGEQELQLFKSRVGILERKGFGPITQITKSKSGNYHAVVIISAEFIPTLIEPLRIAIQACLGSDWKREFLGILKYINNQRGVSKLYRPTPLEVVE